MVDIIIKVNVQWVFGFESSEKNVQHNVNMDTLSSEKNSASIWITTKTLWIAVLEKQRALILPKAFYKFYIKLTDKP